MTFINRDGHCLSGFEPLVSRFTAPSLAYALNESNIKALAMTGIFRQKFLKTLTIASVFDLNIIFRGECLVSQMNVVMTLCIIADL